MSEGWIKLHRKLMTTDLWLAEPFTRGQAWADLILLANYKEGFIRIRGIKIPVNRGQVGWSELKLAERWKWSRNKVRRFISELKTEQQIEQQIICKTSVLTLLNYEEYQGSDTTDGTTNDTTNDTAERQQTEQQKDTNKNIKKEKKEKKDKKKDIYGFTPPTLEEVISYCQERNNKINPIKWYDFYQAKGWMVGKNKMKDWKAAVRTWENNEKGDENNGQYKKFTPQVVGGTNQQNESRFSEYDKL